MSLKQAEIAYYLKMLLDKTKALDGRLDVISEEVARKFTDVPPVPYTGQGNALHFQRIDVVLVEELDLANRRFYGPRCIPKERANVDNDDHWEEDTTIPKIWVDVPQNISIPEVGDYVDVFFSGMYVKDNVEVPKYGLFSPHETMIGITTSYQYPYPERGTNPNTYEVAIFNSKFPQAVGKFTPAPMIARGVVFAHNWANELFQSETYIPQGTYVSVFKSGSYWWFELRSWDYVYFELAQDKRLETNPVICKILVFDGAEWVDSGDRFALWDDYYTHPGFFTGVADKDRGWAKLRKKNADGALDDYELIWMSGPAHIVEFTLTSNRDEGGGGEYVNATIDGAYLYGADQLAPNKVWFRGGTFPFAKTGAVGMAVYDDRNRHYTVFQCDQVSDEIYAALASNMCSNVAVISIPVACIGYPFSQIHPDLEAGGTCLNLHGHLGLAGDTVTLQWMQSLREYNVIDVDKKHKAIAGPMSIDGNNLVQEVYNAAIEYCTPPADNIVNGTPC